MASSGHRARRVLFALVSLVAAWSLVAVCGVVAVCGPAPALAAAAAEVDCHGAPEPPSAPSPSPDCCDALDVPAARTAAVDGEAPTSRSAVPLPAPRRAVVAQRSHRDATPLPWGVGPPRSSPLHAHLGVLLI